VKVNLKNKLMKKEEIILCSACLLGVYGIPIRDEIELELKLR